LFDRLLERIGVPCVVIARLDQAEALHASRGRCIGCTHAAECREWLSLPLPQQSAEAPVFCPSYGLLKRLGAACQKGRSRKN
jgi:hypothetical protein